MEQAIEELLRYAGFTRILLRKATSDLNLNGALIRKGERIILRIIAANRDPERFSHPNQLDVRRRDAGHLSLGGRLACVCGGQPDSHGRYRDHRSRVQRFASVTSARAVDWGAHRSFGPQISKDCTTLSRAFSNTSRSLRTYE
jgi:cytochrome P450